MCRELGLDFGMRSTVEADDVGQGEVVASKVKCKGYEHSLVDCEVDYTNDSSAPCETDAAVSCSKSKPRTSVNNLKKIPFACDCYVTIRGQDESSRLH